MTTPTVTIADIDRHLATLAAVREGAIHACNMRHAAELAARIDAALDHRARLTRGAARGGVPRAGPGA